MMIFGIGANYVSSVFSFVGRALSAGFDWYKEILYAIGLRWEIFSLVIVGFAVVGFLVSSVFSTFRSSADTAVRSTTTYAKQLKKGKKE